MIFMLILVFWGGFRGCFDGFGWFSCLFDVVGCFLGIWWCFRITVYSCLLRGWYNTENAGFFSLFVGMLYFSVLNWFISCSWLYFVTCLSLFWDG